MIYKLELHGRISELSAFPNLWTAVDDLVERNEAAGRQVVVHKRAKDSVQFTLVYPQIDRSVDGTVCVYGRGGKLPVSAEDVWEDVERLMSEGVLRDDICRILSCPTKVYQEAKVIIRRRKLARERGYGRN